MAKTSVAVTVKTNTINKPNTKSFKQEQTEESTAGLHSMRIDYPEGSYRIFTMWNGKLCL